MQRLLTGTRFLIVIPVLGLVIASAFFFIFGGIGLLGMLFELLLTIIDRLGGAPEEINRNVVVVDVVEYVHLFLVGTVLFITAVGLYRLFIRRSSFPAG